MKLYGFFIQITRMQGFVGRILLGDRKKAYFRKKYSYSFRRTWQLNRYVSYHDSILERFVTDQLIGISFIAFQNKVFEFHQR